MIAPRGKIARVDQPSPGLLCISVRQGELAGVVLMSLLPTAAGLGLIAKRPRGEQASAAVTQLRHHLLGASIEAVERSAAFMRIRIRQPGAALSLLGAARKPAGAWWLLDEEGRPVLRSGNAPALRLPTNEAFAELSASELAELGEPLWEQHQAARNRALLRLLERHRKRLVRKRQAIRGDLARVEKLGELRERANLILAHASRIPAKAKFFDAVSWDDPSRRVRIELDPRRSPAEQAQELFYEAKRLERGQAQSRRRLELVADAIEQIDRVTKEGRQPDFGELSDLLEHLGVVKPQVSTSGARRAKSAQRMPYREFVSLDQKRLLVGRNAADNDRLTLRVAKPQHLWLHARGVTGAHVIVALAKGETCSSETLVDAATLAVHFSDARGEAVVDVLYTPRRFVHKRKGFAVGAVSLEREKVLALRMEPSRLERLLSSEKKSISN